MPSRMIVSKELADLLRLLAHPDRLRLIEELRSGERDVTGLARALELPPARVSQHLAMLRAHRLVEDRREGRCHFYHLTRPAIAGWILEALDFVDVPGPLHDAPHIDHVRELWTSNTPETSTPETSS